MRRHLFRQDGSEIFRQTLQCARVSLDLVHVSGLQPGLHIRNGPGCRNVGVNNFLRDAFEIDEQLQNVLRDDRQSFCNREKPVKNVVCNAGVFHRERVERPDGLRQFERDLLDRVNHVFVILDHFADVVQRVGEFV